MSRLYLAEELGWGHREVNPFYCSALKNKGIKKKQCTTLVKSCELEETPAPAAHPLIYLSDNTQGGAGLHHVGKPYLKKGRGLEKVSLPYMLIDRALESGLELAMFECTMIQTRRRFHFPTK